MSPAAWLCLRAELRTRHRSWLVLALLIGLAGGVVFATVAAAGRTESALARHVSAYELADVVPMRGFWIDGRETLDLERVARLPQVATASRWGRLAAMFRSHSGKPVLPDGNAGVGIVVWLDEHGGRDVDRTRLLRGRAPRPGRPDEALVDSTAFTRLGYEIGDTVQVRLVSHAALWGRPSAANRLGEDPTKARTGPLVPVRIVGMVAAVEEGVPGNVMLTPAFYRAHGGRRLGLLFEGLSVRLRHGSKDVPTFERAFRQLAGRDYPGFVVPHAVRPGIQEPIRMQSRVLLLLAVFGAIALLLFIAQAFTRDELVRAPEHATLQVLGMPRRQLAAVAAAGAAVVGGVASAVAVAVAILLSPLAPIGHARELEPAPGLAADPAVLAVGAILMIAATTAVATVVSLRSTRSRPAISRRQRWTPAESVARLGLRPTVVSGVRLALTRGKGTAAVPIAPTLVAVVLAVAVVAASATFSRSLSYLLSTPRLYGAGFDYLFWPEGPPAGRLPPQRWLLTDPTIAAIASATNANVEVDGTPMVAAAQEDVKGSVARATVIHGRAPRAPGEILLGPRTLAALHHRVGDVVTVRAARTERMRVVGSGLALRPLGGDRPWATGAVLTFAGLKRIQPAATYTEYRVRIEPSADRGSVLDRLERSTGLGRFEAPTELANFGGLSGFPIAFSLLFALAGVAMLAHALLTSIRRRRRELALMMVLGFERGQIVACVAWQATTIALVGLMVGLPLGAALARFGWNVFATDLAVLPRPVIPVWQLAVMVPVTLLMANLVAALPASLAARTKPAVALRAE